MRTNAKVYVMRADDGTIKLGHSRNPHTRARHIGRPVLVVHETPVLEHAEKIEKLAHRVLALHGKHLLGEWFESTLEEAVRAIEIAIKQADSEELELGGVLKPRKARCPAPPRDLPRYKSQPRIKLEPQTITIELSGFTARDMNYVRSRMFPQPDVDQFVSNAIREYAAKICRHLDRDKRRKEEKART